MGKTLKAVTKICQNFFLNFSLSRDDLMIMDPIIKYQIKETKILPRQKLLLAAL
jgi:hypothetical protein